MFCPRCGSILLPKKENNKIVMKCSCGYSSNDNIQTKIKEEISYKDKKDERSNKVVENDVETLPLTEVECKKCKHKRAYFWEVQTRAGDEAPTKFLKCEKCKHTWRDYN